MSAESPKTPRRKNAAGGAMLLLAVLLVTAGGVALWIFVVEPMLGKKAGKDKDKPPDIVRPSEPAFTEPDERTAEQHLALRAKRLASELKYESEYRDQLREAAGPGARLAAFPTSHGGAARLLAFSPDGTCLAAASGSTITFWQTHGEAKPKTWNAGKGDITSLLVGSGGNAVIFGDSSGHEKLWLTTDNTAAQEQVRAGQIAAQCLAPESQHIFTAVRRFATPDGPSELIHWRIDDNESSETLKNSGAGIRCLAFSPDQRHLISGQAESITVWNPYAAVPRKTFPLAKGEHAVSLAVTPDAKFAVVAVTGFKTGRLALIDLHTGDSKTLADLPAIQSVDVTYDGKAYVASARKNDGATYHLYDVDSGKLIKLLEVTKGAGAMALSPFAMFLAVPDEGEVILWDVERLRMKK